MKAHSPSAPKQGSKKSVFGVANSRIHANRIVDHLTNAGFDRGAISILFPGGNPDQGGAAETSPSAFPAGRTVQIGLAVGGAIGWLAGLDAFSVPGFGHLIAAGPLCTILSTSPAGPVAAHGVKRALEDLGLHRNSARLYQDQVRDGQILICLQTNEWREAEAARKVFLAMGAANISISGPKASGLLKRAFSRVARRMECLTPEFEH